MKKLILCMASALLLVACEVNSPESVYTPKFIDYFGLENATYDTLELSIRLNTVYGSDVRMTGICILPSARAVQPTVENSTVVASDVVGGKVTVRGLASKTEYACRAWCFNANNSTYYYSDTEFFSTK